MNKKLFNNKGFTLIEILIYAGILGIASTILSGILLSTTQIKSRQTAGIEVNDQLNFALQSIQRAVMDSSVIDITSGVSTSTLVLKFKDDAQNPTKIYISNGKLYKQVASNEAQPLTSESVVANAVNFLKISGYSGHDSVQVDLTLSYNSQNPAQSFSRTLSSAIARVSAATFDSNLIPGSDNFYDIGLNSTKWKDMYLSGNLYTAGNVGIGTTGPGAKLDVAGETRIGAFSADGLLRIRGDAGGYANRFLRIGRLSRSAYEINDEYYGIIIDANERNIILQPDANDTGNVGIGTTEPKVPLHVLIGGSAISPTDTNTKFMVQTGGTDVFMSMVSTSSLGSAGYYMGTTTATNLGRVDYDFSSDKMRFFVNTSQKMTIDSSGNVGIGATSPGGLFEVFQSGTGRTRGSLLVDEANSIVYVGRLSGTGGDSTDNFIVRDRLNIKHFDVDIENDKTLIQPITGNVGIGTTNPVVKLDFGTSVANVGKILNFYSDSGNNRMGIGMDSASAGMRLYAPIVAGNHIAFGGIANAAGQAWTEWMRVDTNSGNVGIGATAPTSKLQVVGLPVYANNAAAVAGGLTAGAFYRTGGDPDPVCVVH